MRRKPPGGGYARSNSTFLPFPSKFRAAALALVGPNLSDRAPTPRSSTSWLLAAHQLSPQRSRMEPTGGETTIDETADVTVGHSRVQRSSGSDTRIRAVCGTVVRCSEGASRLSGFLSGGWMSWARRKTGRSVYSSCSQMLASVLRRYAASSTSSSTPLPASWLVATIRRLVLERPASTSRRYQWSISLRSIAQRAFSNATISSCTSHSTWPVGCAGRRRSKFARFSRLPGTFPSDQRQRDSLSESVLTPPTDPRPGTAAPGGALACGAPPTCTLIVA